MPPAMIALGPGEAHLWYVLSDEVRDPALLAAYHALMSPDEAEKQRRFYFEKGRHEYLLTRALARSVLSRYAPVAPKDWSFVRNAHGRPEIAGPAGLPPLRFNLSNTDGLIACLVLLERDAGVDVEHTGRSGETVKLADRFFAPAEVRALHALPAERQRARFFDCWTLKEAYIKARGMGLAIPLSHFSFELDAGERIGIAFDPRLEDDPEAWRFTLMSPTADHRMATAIRVGRGAGEVRIEVRRTVPLVE